METNANTPMGTGESVQDAATAFASLLAVADGEPTSGEAQPEVPDDEERKSSDEDTDGSEDESEEPQESDEESESDSEEDSEEQEEQPASYRVKVDGEEVEVTLDELQKGYSRTQDYTRKTQALADQRKAVEAEQEVARQERAYYAQMLGVLQQQLSQEEAQPDWDRLYQENPNEWVRQRELWRDKQDRARAVQAEQERIAALTQQEQAKQRTEQLSREADRLVDAIPEWKDAKVANTERGKLLEAGKRAGFTDAELNNILDHRAVVVLRKAALYDELMGKKTQIKPNPTSGPKLAKPGSATTKPSKKSDSQRAQERLAKTGNMADAVAAFDSFI